MVIINVYMPCNHKNISSLSSFMASCQQLRAFLLIGTNQGLNWSVAGDINAYLLSQSERSYQFFDVLPSGYKLVNKDKQFNFNYNHDGARSNPDYIIVSNGSLGITPVIVLDYTDWGWSFAFNFEIELPVLLAYECSSNHNIWFDKPNWKRVNCEIYLYVLCLLLSMTFYKPQ